MEITVTGKHTQLGTTLTEHVKDHLTHIVSKTAHNVTSAEVIFTKEKRMFRTDIHVHDGNIGGIINSHANAEDAYDCFDLALKKIDNQLHRHKERLTNHHPHTTYYPNEENNT